MNNPSKVWVYRTKKGEIFGEVRRYDEITLDGQSQKSIIPHFNKNCNAGVPKDMPAVNRLFGLDSLSDPSQPVFIVEGEKCAHALHGLGFQAITSLGGSNQAHLADWLALVEFRTVYLLPDNDEAGIGYMKTVYQYLRAIDPIPHVQIVTIPNLPHKGDVVDWLMTLHELTGWNGLDDLHNHVNGDVVGMAFEKLYQTKIHAVPAEWAFIRTKGNLKAIDAESFDRLDIPERQALLYPLFMQGSINMVFASRGLGKTFFCLSCGVAMAKGESFLKYDCDRIAKVLYLDGEMQAPLMQNRLRMLSDGLLPKDFHIFTPDVQEVDVIPDLSTAQGQLLMDELIDRTGAEVIFIDNISTFMRTGNENDAESWSIVQPWLVRHRSKGRSFVLVHHSNKAGEQRGSNKKEDVMDVVVHLSRPDDYVQGEDRTRLLVQLTKARHIFGEDAQDVEAELETVDGKAIWRWSVAESSYQKAIMLLKDGKLTQQEIAEDLKVHKATITKWKKKAEAEGLL